MDLALRNAYKDKTSRIKRDNYYQEFTTIYEKDTYPIMLVLLTSITVFSTVAQTVKDDSLAPCKVLQQHRRKSIRYSWSGN
jgi:hypothetical protein